MVSRRRRPIPARRNRRNSRRTNGLRRQLALVAHRLPVSSRLPRDPPPVTSGFDYTVRISFMIRMYWTDPTTTESFHVELPTDPLGFGVIVMSSRNTVDGAIPTRRFYLDYEEVFTSAFMRATGTNFTNLPNAARASIEFAMLGVRAWGPASASATMTLRCDGGDTVAGFAKRDTPGRNHRAAIGCAYSTIDWRKFNTIDRTTPAILVSLSHINFAQFAPQAAGTSFGVMTGLDMGELQVTVRMRYKLAVTASTILSSSQKGPTVFLQEDDV